MSDAVFSRLAAYRDAQGINQKALSKAMGFNDRQTLSAVENGERALKSKELLAALEFMGVTLKDFLDPTSMVGKAKFSWRQQEATPEDLTETEQQVSKLIGLFEHVRKTRNGNPQPLLFKLPLNKHSSIDEAQKCAESLVTHLELGKYPAKKLMEKVSQLGIDTLHLDLNENVSAAAINVTKGNYIVVNRKEVHGRLNFNYAHELFHILTWDALPPKHSEQAYSVKKGKKPIEEKLADAFAEALLMPRESVLSHVEQHNGTINESFINSLANSFDVSSAAMKYRLHRLQQISQKQLDALDDNLLRFNGGNSQAVLPRLYNEVFIKELHDALYHGDVSARKALENLGLSVSELNEVFSSYNLAPAFEL
ncbi:XRE family transcriptional regulator [Vibrio vulnificus]|nr:XRE family transcriptional regulator [Vibrio vulnificus]